MESFQRFFTMIGHELAEAIEFVCSDMWQIYLQLIEQHYTRALNILDRFHVIAKIKGDRRGARRRRSHNSPTDSSEEPYFYWS